MKKSIILILIAAALASCNRYDIEEVLLHREDISLTVKGIDQITFKSETYQIGYDGQSNTFRVFDDDLAHWFVLTCNERPASEDQEIKADLAWTTPNATRSKKGLSFKVEKTDAEGHFWLWCKDEAIGVVVREL